jgi:hypothetical protein
MKIIHPIPAQRNEPQNVMGKFKKRHNGMTQTREPPIFDSS